MNEKMYRVEDKYDCSLQTMYQLQQRLSGVLKADGNESTGRVMR